MSDLKQKIKGILPLKFVFYFYLLKAVKASLYDLKRRVYDKVYDNSEVDRVKRDLTLAYHIVEKGLTMPEPRPGFGKKVVISLVNTILKYDKMNLPHSALEFRQSVSVLKEYYQYHQEIKFETEPEVKQKLELILSRYPSVDGEHQLHVTSADYFKHINDPFDQFCRSRFSVRNYTPEEIPVDVLYQCIDLAQKSPSFCNRQPTRVHIVKSPTKKEGILSIQNGNRGFGHLAETLLVLTSVVSTTKDIHERFENHLNGGMFAMTLLNALHFNKIGACSLNWSVSADKDAEIRKILDVAENEVVLVVISCGYIPNQIAIASSPRKKANEITYLHLK